MTQHQARIDVILFDLGGVLIELAGVEKMLEWSPGIATTDELWRRWLALGSRSSIRDRRDRPRRVRGERSSTSSASPWAQANSWSAFTWWPRSVFPGAFELLAEMRARYRLASVSNTNEIHWDRFSNTWSLDAAFHHNFPSHLVGKLKPDAEYFEHVLDAMDVPAPRVLFIDDNAINVEAAAKLGIVTRRVAGVDGAREAFRELGLLS